MMHRTRHFWTLCVWRTRTPRRATFVFTPHFWLAIQNIGVWCAYLHGHLYPRNCSYPIARTMCSSGRQASLMERFSWGSTISGSVSCFSFFQSIRWPTRDWKRTNVHMFHCWRNTKVTEDQVIFCIFCILYIYCIFLLWFFWLLCSLVGCVPIHHRIRAPWVKASLVCYSSVLHTGKVASCSCWQYRDDTVRDAKGSSRLYRHFFRQRKGQQRRLQVVVREQLGPQLGYKAMMGWGLWNLENKQQRLEEFVIIQKYAKYVKYAQYAQYICKICKKICNKIC